MKRRLQRTRYSVFSVALTLAFALPMIMVMLKDGVIGGG